MSRRREASAQPLRDGFARRKAESAKDIYVFDSAKLTNSLLRDGLIDEIMACVAPILLGAGTPSFTPGSPARKLSLTQARPLSSGAVILNYAVTACGSAA